MKQLPFLLVLVILASCSSRKPSELRLVEGYTYNIDSAGHISDTTLSARLWYNEAGKLMKEERLFSDSKGHHRLIKLYDTSGNVVRKEGIYRDSSFISNTDFTRDDHNEILKQVFTGTDGTLTLNHRNIYNEKGKILRSIMSAENPAEPGTTKTGEVTYTYDGQGRQTGFTEVAEGKILSEFEFAYDENGNRKSEITRANNLVETINYKYNSDKQKIEQEYYKNSLLVSKTTYEWAGKIAKRETTHYPNGKVQVVFYK